MAFEIEKLINDILNSKTLNTVFNNPIYFAVITVAIVLLIIYLTLRNDVVLTDDSNTSMMALMITAGIYCILAVLGLVYLQHRAMGGDFEQKYTNRAHDEVIQSVVDGQGELTTLDIFNQKPVLHDIDIDSTIDESIGGTQSSVSETSTLEKSNKSRKKKYKKCI